MLDLLFKECCDVRILQLPPSASCMAFCTETNAQIISVINGRVDIFGSENGSVTITPERIAIRATTDRKTEGILSLMGTVLRDIEVAKGYNHVNKIALLVDGDIDIQSNNKPYDSTIHPTLKYAVVGGLSGL